MTSYMKNKLTAMKKKKKRPRIQKVVRARNKRLPSVSMEVMSECLRNFRSRITVCGGREEGLTARDMHIF